MVLFVTIVGLAFVLGAAIVVKVGHMAARRLGLDPWMALVWLGVAEAPVDELAAKRAEPAARGARDRQALASSFSG